MASSFTMASSSGPASSSVHDVFINHRGPDVKNTFASHLYRRLRDCGVTAFLDREEMEKGEEFFSQIVHAISGASVHIAIFSQRYAESIWCLKELVLMKNSRATIFPVFYKIEPSVVRWTDKKGAYAEALRGLEQKKIQDAETGEEKPRYSSDTIQEWRKALYYVAGLDGFTLRGDEDEVKFLDEVVESVLKKVPKPPLHVAQYPTGLDLKLQELEKILLSEQQQEERVEAKVLGIVGVGGVGKTTLAKEFYNSHRLRYNASSFLSDVREVAVRMSLEYLQSQLIKDLKHVETRIGRHEGIEILKRHLSLCQVLIILDDVDHASQLEAFLPIKDVISPNSLILIISRNKHVLKSSGVLDSSIYNLEGLDTPQSRKLFCSYAFSPPLPLPPPEYTDLVDQFVTACKGLPLSLKLIGAHLCGENEKSYWQGQLERLYYNHTLPDEVFKTLRISYDSLLNQDQSIFLDIVCFFIGEDIDKGIRIWGIVGLRNLQNKCLLEVDTQNKIKMHDHIRDMGRNIAEERTMPRRFWDSTTNIIDNLLVQPSTVITEVRGIKMVSSSYEAFWDSEMIWFPTRRSSRTRLSKYIFNNSHIPVMRNLQLLATEDDKSEDILRRIQPHLKWLRWYRISHSSLPNWIQMKNLKVLEVEGRRLNLLWPHQSQGVPLDLRELNIWAPLSEIPRSIGQLEHLERIAIHNPGGALERLPDEFCRLGSLKYLMFRGFSKMVSLPDRFGELTNLEHIDLEGASSLQTLPDSFGKLTLLRHLSLRRCKSLTISNGTLGDITTLEYLNLYSCEHVDELPQQVAHQVSLQELYLDGMNLKELPCVGCNLKVLELGGSLLEMLPPNLGDLNCLKILSLRSSPQLKSLPDSIGAMTQLTISLCGIECLPRSVLKMNNLESLEVWSCPLWEHPFKKEVEGETEWETASNKLNSSTDRSMFGLKKLQLSFTEIMELYFDEGVCPNLQQLTVTDCSELRQIGGLRSLPKLRDLRISDCAKVELYGLETLTSLETLTVSKCKRLQGIPRLGQFTTLHLASLERWSVGVCEKLQIIPGLGQFTTLRELDVSRCDEIQALSNVEHLASLERLSVGSCEKLQIIPGLGQLTMLRRLDVINCCEIQALPGVEHLTSLETLNVGGCQKLQSIPSLGQLTKLRRVYVYRCGEIQVLPTVKHLTYLDVQECEKLLTISALGQLRKLTKLNVSKCNVIQELPGVEHLISLEELNVRELGKLKSIEWLGQLAQIRELNVSKCHEIFELPGVEHLISLERLNVSGLGKLKSIQELGQLAQIRELDVSKCHEISELPSVEHLTFLEKLNISGLGKLKSIPGLEQLIRIRELNVSECPEISELPSMELLTSLEKLNISGLGKLKKIPGLGQLTQIKELNVSKCGELRELQCVECLMSLEILNACDCPKLRWREGIVEQLCQQLKEGFKYEEQRKQCNCLEFLQFLCRQCLTALA